MSRVLACRPAPDVQELIKARQLDAAFAEQIDPSVRAAFLDLQRAVRAGSD